MGCLPYSGKLQSVSLWPWRTQETFIVYFFNNRISKLKTEVENKVT